VATTDPRWVQALAAIMNMPTNLFRRGYELLVAGGAALQSPFLLVLRLYVFWQLFLTGKGKLSNIGKVSEFFASLGIPLPTLNAYFIYRFARMFRELAADHRLGIATSVSSDRILDDCLPHGRFRGHIEHVQRS
jgi:DoxX-like protein